jgi:voltage-gated potassium channel
LERKYRPILFICLSIVLLAIGTLGYVVIEDWPLMDSLYMVVITLTTVGYGEIRQISSAGRMFTILLILTGVGFYLYVVGHIIQFLVEGRIREVLGRRRLEQQINRLKNHFIVCGYGRIGRVLCRYLTQKYLDVVVIEKNLDRIPVIDDDGILYIIGDATDESTLVRAGIDHARGLLTVLATDANNVFLVLTARQHNPDLFIVARAEMNATKKTLTAAGADKVISPYDLGARRMAHAILRPTVIHFLELAFADDKTDIQLEEATVDRRSSLVGVTLKDSQIRQDMNVIIVSIKKPDGSMVFNPSADYLITEGDTFVVVGDSRNLQRLSRRLNPL